MKILGVAPVPDRDRTTRSGMLFLIWVLASASVTTPVVGLLLHGIGLIPAMLLSHMGRQTPSSPW